jgi:uncharacterized HhH-GPD family protein
MPALPITGDPEADELLERDSFALLLGMLLDQQFPMERAFRGPFELKQRLGGRLDAAELAAMDPEELAAVFARPPVVHRYPRSMAARTQALAGYLVEQYDGRTERLWADAQTGQELFANLRALPGFGAQKAQIFVALLAKRFGVQPAGWQEVAGGYGEPGWFSVADVDGPDALLRVREHKKAVKAEAKAKAAG